MNVVIVVTDDQEGGTVNADAMPYLSSQPHGHWVTFPNGRQSTSLCGPSRSNLLTGQRDDHNGVLDNINDDGIIATEDCINVAVQNTGAVTGLFGKWLNDYDATTVPDGWDDWWAWRNSGGGESYEGWTATSNLSGSVVQEDETDYPGEYITDIIAGHAVDFINEHAASPFLLWVTPTAPHNPATPAARHASVPFTLPDPADWNQAPTNAPSWLATYPSMSGAQQTAVRTERLQASRCLLAVDELIESIIDALDANDLLDDTIVIFCTDNGVALGRKKLGNNAPGGAGYAWSKTSPYGYASDLLLRVRHPAAEQRTDSRLVDSLDLPAMILDVFNATPLAPLDGRSLLPIVLDTPGTPWRSVSFSEYTGAQPNTAQPRWRAARTARWRYGHYYEVAETELYDLVADPQETANVAATYPDVCDELQARIDEWVADSQAPVTWPPVPAVLSYTVGASSFVGNLA